MSHNKVKLSPKQILFINEYLVDFNATQAAIRAGYSRKSAHSIGQENLKKPAIQIAIREIMDKNITEVEVSANYVLKRLIEESKSLAQDATANSRIRATELLGKYLTLFTDRHEVDNKASLVLALEELQKKKEARENYTPHHP
jgi:phage terminase small subunit